MRRRRFSAVLAAAATLLVGCGGGQETATPPVANGAFPVTITHGQGTVTIPAAPQRVVVLGLADTQIAAALGAPIVGATINPSSPDGAWRGVTPQVPAELRTLDSITPDVEAIAALRPDLILMTSAQPGFSAAYEQISAIAPTISYKTALLQDSGEDLTRMIGRALGKDAEAEALIRESSERLASFKADHPGLQGKAYAFGQYAQGTTYVVIAQDGPTAKLFDAVGVRLPDPIAALPVWQAGMAQVAPENLGVLDSADVAFFAVSDGGQAFTAQPLVGNLVLVRSGGIHFLAPDQASLLLQPNPATTAAVLDLIGPLLEQVPA
jgi:iron complex transport system substrate-binding protein